MVGKMVRAHALFRREVHILGLDDLSEWATRYDGRAVHAADLDVGHHAGVHGGLGRRAVRAALPSLGGERVARARPAHAQLLADAHRALRAARHSGAAAPPLCCSPAPLPLCFHSYSYTRTTHVLRQAPPFDMSNECSSDPHVYSNYTNVRCADQHANWLVFVFLGFFVLLTNIVFSTFVFDSSKFYKIKLLLYNLVAFQSSHRHLHDNIWTNSR